MPACLAWNSSLKGSLIMLTRVLVVDDHAIVRKGILMFLDNEPSVQIVGEATDGQDALQKAEWLKPDVILLDLVMPDGDGIRTIAELRSRFPETKIIVLTRFDDE
jgi:DNA-binding NarL/FixJ family response regulator